jgi:hypothetical protein
MHATDPMEDEMSTERADGPAFLRFVPAIVETLRALGGSGGDSSRRSCTDRARALSVRRNADMPEPPSFMLALGELGSALRVELLQLGAAADGLADHAAVGDPQTSRGSRRFARALVVIGPTDASSAGSATGRRTAVITPR